jgi:hypothetical protein
MDDRSSVEAPYTVASIGSVAVVGDDDATDEELAAIAGDRFRYVPLPATGEFYDASVGERATITAEQVVPADLTLLEGMRVLADLPFLLIEPGEGVNPIGEYHIVTRADLNRRPVEAAIYPVISTLEDRLAALIEREYPDSETLVGLTGPFPVGSWTKARTNDLDVHIAEFLSLTDMVGIVKGNDRLLRELGYEDPAELESDLYAVGDLRNRVMHGNRSLVLDPDDVATHVERIDLARDLIRRLDDANGEDAGDGE